MVSKGLSPTLDTSLGLIYRLNILWTRVDTPAASGNFDRWNFLLDRIFCNLMYRNDFEIIKDDEGKITNVNLNEEDQELYDHLNKKVWESNEKLSKAKTPKEKHLAKLDIYNSLMMKDMGLRKFMHNTLKLYLKEVDSNPSKAMWGG